MIQFGSSMNCCETKADSSFPCRDLDLDSRDARDTQNQIWLQIILCFIKFIAFWFSHAVFICFPGDKINFEAHNAAKFVFFCLRLETFLNVIYVPVHVDFFAWCLLKKEKNFFRCRFNVKSRPFIPRLPTARKNHRNFKLCDFFSYHQLNAFY